MAAAEVEDCFSDRSVPACAGDGGAFLDEAAHGSYACAGGDEDDREGRIGGEVEVRGIGTNGAVDFVVGMESGKVRGGDSEVRTLWVAQGRGSEDVVSDGYDVAGFDGEGGGRDGELAGLERG